jgi:hypothetical protein
VVGVNDGGNKRGGGEEKRVYFAHDMVERKKWRCAMDGKKKINK